MPAPSHYYVWYRVTGDPVAARAAGAAVLHGVTVATGVAGRWRVGRGAPATWMEVYESVADAATFDAGRSEPNHRITTKEPSPTRAIGAAEAFMKR